MESVKMNKSKRKRVSKKSKSSWRKHSDVKDVDEFLEQKRFEERTGGPARKKPNSELFFIDKEQKSSNEKPEKSKTLRCHMALEPDTKIKPIIQSTNVVSKKRKLNEKTKKSEKTNDMRNAEAQSTTLDLWGDSSKVSEDIDEHFAKVCKKQRVTPPVHHSKKRGVEVVDVPLPGSSYNPTFDDHQELLRKALEVELKKEKEEERIKRAMDDKFPALTEAPNESTWLKEMSGGLATEEVEEEEEEEEDVTAEQLAEVSNNPPVRREDKKTEKERRKQKEKLLKERELQKEKEMKERIHNEFRLKTAKKLALRREMELAARAARRELEKEKKKNNPKKLGKLKFTEPNIPVKLTEELQGSLRLLKPEGHVLETIFSKMQKKGQIETRLRAKSTRKYKPKQFDKKSHKAIVA